LKKLQRKKFAAIITAPPAKLCLAGGFRTFSTFQGFGHGDSLVVFQGIGWIFYRTWILFGFSRMLKKKLTDIGF
jgi:hypothetical protein